MGGTDRHLLFWKKQQRPTTVLQKASKAAKVLVFYSRLPDIFCHKLTCNQCWFDTLTALCTGPQRKTLADYSLRRTVNSSPHFMQTAFAYTIFTFNLMEHCNVSTQFCKHPSNLTKVSILCMNLYRMAQQKLWKRMLLLCCLRHLSFTEIAQYPVRLTCKVSFTVSSVGLCNRYTWKNLQSTFTNNILTVEFSVLMILSHWHTLHTYLKDKNLLWVLLSKMVKPVI